MPRTCDDGIYGLVLSVVAIVARSGNAPVGASLAERALRRASFLAVSIFGFGMQRHGIMPGNPTLHGMPYSYSK